ncbi:MAG: TolC family protein [Candidatus Acidiferrales bacterium]
MIRRWATLIAAAGFLLLPGAKPALAQTQSPYATMQESTQTSPASAPVQNSFSGSVPGKLVPGVLPLSLSDAIERGLKQNLGVLLSSQDIRAARGAKWKELSALLPQVTASPFINVSQIDLGEYGFTFPGVSSAIGPFSYFDARAGLNQTLFNWKAINKTRGAAENEKAAAYSYKDARDLVVLAVGYTYLRSIADQARIDTAGAEVKVAQALSDQASDQVKAGTSPSIDALRAQVELKTRQQQWIQTKNDFAIQKLTLARVIGLAPGQEFEITDKSPYQPLDGITLDEALARAYASRSDFQAAVASEKAAEYERKAAVAGYYPSLSLNADYGVAGQHPATNAHGVFDVRGTLTIPIFEGGRTHGEVLEAEAQFAQSRERVENLRSQIDSDVRTAMLNLESSSEEVAVARDNVGLAEQTLTQSRDRFSAGVTDTVEVVQAEEQVASAHENYISSLYNYNYAKISLARALGAAEQSVKEYFKGQ